MSHGIMKPIDRVFSTRNPEWHKLAEVVKNITDMEAALLSFPIIEGNIFAGGSDVMTQLVNARLMLNDPNGYDLHAVRAILDSIALSEMPNHKALIADMRVCRPDLAGGEDELVPLHIPKHSYRPITNGELWNEMKKSLADVNAEITCIGTLEAGKKFFISVELPGESEKTINGDKFLHNLNFVTSHDGTLAAQAYDSNVRIVCMNTLRWSLEAAGEVGFKVFHTKGADLAIANMGDLLNQILKGRVHFRNAMEMLADIPMDARGAHEIALGFLLQDKEPEASTRTLNAAEAIATLFSRGTGNAGKTAYDLLNGGTEYWTSGDGTGKKATATEKAFKAGFGTAADHKNAFCNLLVSGADAIAKVREIGRAALVASTAK